ncbi:predicted protein [Uncinocarpus reesii 1704]|uniref:Uncharacterized protein n=1 Tax=Uncinocarpus reesii (strain UAMH 1704) TaxID=336963 RepID=C4JEV9_UNCRE|nr:uncharacterized protein UREG_00859 [Uncinocarpus reesii 1704]EEP76012.1 predicted protein [Uncinocarpus reesii 1704]
MLCYVAGESAFPAEHFAFSNHKFLHDQTTNSVVVLRPVHDVFLSRAKRRNQTHKVNATHPGPERIKTGGMKAEQSQVAAHWAIDWWLQRPRILRPKQTPSKIHGCQEASSVLLLTAVIPTSSSHHRSSPDIGQAVKELYSSGLLTSKILASGLSIASKETESSQPPLPTQLSNGIITAISIRR